MKTELKAKFLQHLNQKKSEKGFTLIELLVVIIIIGILAAIALPTFLNQTAKGKQSEAKQNVSSINKTQTSYRAEKTGFSSNFDLLALGTFVSTNGGTQATTNNYTYTFPSSGQDSTTILATAGDTALKSYSGGTVRFNNAQSQAVMTSVICEANAPGTAAAVPTTATTAAPTCNTSSTTTVQP